MNAFYIGYFPNPPEELARFLRRVVFVIFLVTAAAGVTLVLTQRHFAAAFFEFNSATSFEGVIETAPYPTLLVRRPGLTPVDQKFSRYLLVGVGKHGADSDVSGFESRFVTLRGKLIYRAGQTMVEVMPGSVRAIGSGKLAAQPVNAGPHVTIRGEIVDSKCYTGVMNPGEGKVHRDCAVRCLSGGVPPILIAEKNGTTKVYWLADSNGEALQKKMFIDKVAEPVSVSGNISKRGDAMIVLVREINRSH
jgi:hypothetical protein